MTIATKNGSVIIKDGSVAQNCGCCGGWICCQDPACLYQLYDVRLTISTNVPYTPVPESPYTATFILPYLGPETSQDSNGSIVSAARTWGASLGIEEDCGNPAAVFKAVWPISSGYSDDHPLSISYSYSISYNAHHIYYGNKSSCVWATKSYGSYFVGGCGIAHKDSSSPQWGQPGWQYFYPTSGSFSSFPRRHAKLRLEFIERQLL
jgi:hypothetical protein